MALNDLKWLICHKTKPTQTSQFQRLMPKIIANIRFHIQRNPSSKDLIQILCFQMFNHLLNDLDSDWNRWKSIGNKSSDYEGRGSTSYSNDVFFPWIYQAAVVKMMAIIFSMLINSIQHTFLNVVHSISFQTFFVQAFKIVVDSWKFSMLLLYILWDDWPIFMISGSNEHLQQELEYTLLKPDCHSWWISKMQSDTLEERYAMKFCFKLGKMPQKHMECFRLLFDHLTSVFKWHKRFKEDRESVRDDERSGRSKDVITAELIGQRFRVRVTMLRC